MDFVIIDNLSKNKDLGQKAKVNSYDDFKLAFVKSLDTDVVQECSKNTKFYGRLR